MKFKSVTNPKTERIYVRVTNEEKQQIEEKAHDCLLPVSDFILKCARGRQTRSKIDSLLIEELRQLGMQLKEIYQAELPREATELDPVMSAVIEAIVRIASEPRIRL